MSYLLILRGPLGVGKTTIARQLQQTIKADYISIDEILAANALDHMDPNEGCIPEANFRQAINLILPDINQNLQHHQPVILDGCFYHLEAIAYLQKSLPFPSIIVTLQAPLATCIARDKERQKSFGPDAAKAVYKLVSRFTIGKTIDATKPQKEIVNDILALLTTSI